MEWNFKRRVNKEGEWLPLPYKVTGDIFNNKKILFVCFYSMCVWILFYIHLYLRRVGEREVHKRWWICSLFVRRPSFSALLCHVVYSAICAILTYVYHVYHYLQNHKYHMYQYHMYQYHMYQYHIYHMYQCTKGTVTIYRRPSFLTQARLAASHFLLLAQWQLTRVS